jgi:tetratricopeptide (TPR) repeat protein
MGRFEYAPAREVFAELAAAYPQWHEAQVNLAIATLNRQLPGDEQAAVALVDRVIEQDPAHLRAHYVAGLLRLYLSSPAEALPHFARVREADPADAHAAYYAGQCLAQLGRHEAALEALRAAIALDPYLRSAYYGAFQALQRLRQGEEARRLAGEYQRLAANPRARLAEFKYTRMGPKAEALAVDLDHPPVPALPPPGPVFGQPRPLPISGTLPALEVPPGPVGLAAADLQGDGLPDLVLAGVVAGDPPRNLVLLGLPDGTWRADPGHPLAAVSAVRAVALGDLDNDGRTDAYLARHGPNQLWRQVGPGEWRELSGPSGSAGGTPDTVDVALLDADHDGDLDVFLVNADGANELLSNNGDGTFRALASAQGLGGRGQGTRTVVPVDLDRDRDADLVVINREAPHEAYLNDRLWQYAPAPGLLGFAAEPALTALAADLDADGLAELYALTPDGLVRRWTRGGDGTYAGRTLARLDLDEPVWAQLAVLDSDGDGRLELLVASREGWSLLDPDGKVLVTVASRAAAALAGATPWLADPTRGPGVLTLDRDGVLTLTPPGGGRYGFLALRLSGARDPAHGMRSNASGIGTRVAVRADSRWTVVDGYRAHSGPGQGLQPLAVGLGAEGKADFVAIDWSDGVFQSEVDLGPGTVHSIAETQRQLSSCPVLFAWDGERHAFVTDFLGVGGLGYALGPGVYAEPRPWENVLLPDGLARPHDGRYVLKLTEPMEEVGYLDRITLTAYDLPPGWQLVLDERMATGAPAATGEPRFYRVETLPVVALNGRGEDVTAAVLEADGRAAPLGQRDLRFIGRLAAEETLTLRFAGPIDAGPGEALLVADGWVEYPYSQTSFAAWQAGASFDPPTLEALGANGRWVTLWRQFGYPAGMPRRMSVPLAGLPPGTAALRLRGNLEVYWDRLAVAYAEPLAQAVTHALPLAAARLAVTGFPLRTDGPQRRPDYDYGRRSPFWDTRHPGGFYTRPGPVDELLIERDEALAILGPGEEVHVEFAAPERAPPPGWSRRLVLGTAGWTKDMDLYTRDGETVEPLPTAGGAGAPGAAPEATRGLPPGADPEADPGHRPTARELLHGRYNTRYLAGY